MPTQPFTTRLAKVSLIGRIETDLQKEPNTHIKNFSTNEKVDIALKP